ncbi:MAG: phosphate-binding protein [Ectothiorhodospiraceae bacterium]|nr:phosphate-binding protein [Ectothiorhodospiraceae bacterium]
MRLRYLALVFILLAAVGLNNGIFAVESITITGSDTMVILAQRWAEEYMRSEEGISIQVSGGGSGTGIAALINGTTDICSASRPVTQGELKRIREKYGTTGVQVTVAKDGILVYINQKNPVSSITSEQLRKIYTGELTNWNEIGGPDHQIIVYGRENNSGTHYFFKQEILLGDEFSTSVQSLQGTSAVVNAVSHDPYGIGYGGTAYASGVKIVGINDILPTKDNVTSGRYPLARDLYMYLRYRPSGHLKTFVDWVLSTDGQGIVDDIGYYPVR